MSKQTIKSDTTTTSTQETFDLIVLDGTWEQARRLYKRYIPPDGGDGDGDGGPRRVQLSPESLRTFDGKQNDDDNNDNNDDADNNDDQAFTGRQLRRHPIAAREIATAHALQLLLQDIVAATDNSGNSNHHPQQPQYYDIFGKYQQIASAAASAQLGPVRLKQSS